MKYTSLALLIVGSVLLTGCATNQAKYAWNDYESGLYEHYKNPQEPARLIEVLQASIEKAEHGKERVPPGVYAELGYALMSAGRDGEAIVLFQKEKATWPESARFMDKMILTAEKKKAMPVAAATESGVQLKGEVR
jgi:hypothetical protein